MARSLSPVIARLGALAFALALLLGGIGPLPRSVARADGLVEVTVRLKDGRSVKGLLVAEGEAGVTLKLAFGEMVIRKEEIAGIDRPEAPAGDAASPGSTGAAPADAPRMERHLVITLRDGTVRRGAGIDRGEHYELDTGLGVLRIPKADVRLVEETEVLVDPLAVARAAPLSERARVVDAALGIEVARPGDAWRFSDAPTSPGARVELYRLDLPVTFEVLVADALPVGLREPTADREPAVRAHVNDVLRRRFRSHRGLQVVPVRARGVPAWQIAYEGDARTLRSRAIARELWLHPPTTSAMVILRATLTTERGTAEPDPVKTAALLDEALASVGFTGGLDLDAGTLVDRRLGVRLRAPPGWKVRLRVGDDRSPIELCAPGAPDARYYMAVHAADGAATADAFVDRLESERRRVGTSYRRERRDAQSLGELSAVELVHRDVDAEGRATQVRRFVWIDGARALELVAQERAGDPGAEGRRAVVESLFRSLERAREEPVEPFIATAARVDELLLAAEVALEDRSGVDRAIVALDEAIRRMPTCAFAYLMRGRLYADRERYEEALADLDRANRFGRISEVRPLLARVQNHRAKALASTDWRQAEQLFRAAIENDPKSASYPRDLVNAVLAQSRALSEKGHYDAAIAICQDAYRREPAEDRYRAQFVRAHHDWARALMRTKELRDLYKARTMLRKVKPQDTGSGTDNLLQLVEAEIKRQGGR